MVLINQTGLLSPSPITGYKSMRRRGFLDQCQKSVHSKMLLRLVLIMFTSTTQHLAMAKDKHITGEGENYCIVTPTKR